MHPFSTHWKHQKTVRFSVFRRHRKCALGTNELNCYKGVFGTMSDIYDANSVFLQKNSNAYVWRGLKYVSHASATPFKHSSKHCRAEAYSEPFRTSKMKRFTKIVNCFYQLTIFVKRSILDVWQGFEYTSAECHKENQDLDLVSVEWESRDEKCNPNETHLALI